MDKIVVFAITKNQVVNIRWKALILSIATTAKFIFPPYDPHKSQVIYQEDYYSGVDNGYGDYALEIKTKGNIL